MYETQLLKIKIKRGQTKAAQQFIESIDEQREQCLDTFREDGMVVESIFFERTPAGDFLYVYAKAQSLTQADRVFRETTDALRLKIKEFVEQTWGETVALEPLLDLDLIKEAAISNTELD